MHEPNNYKFAEDTNSVMDRIKEKMTTQILNYYGDECGNIEAKCKEINNDFEEVVANKITYPVFLSKHPEVLYSQRRSMLYNLLRGYSTASRETRTASIYKYCVDDNRETKKLHEILFGDEACIFPDHYADVFSSEYKLVSYITLLSELVEELELPMNRLGSIIVADIIRLIKSSSAYNYAPFKRIRTVGNLQEMSMIVGVDYITPIKNALEQFRFKNIQNDDLDRTLYYLNKVTDSNRKDEILY